MRSINEIIIHCTATPEGRVHTVADIRSWHLQRKFNDIGYHYVVYIDGSVHAGRPVEKMGAHCLGHNANSIGVCYVGGLTKDCKKSVDTRTDAQKQALRRLVADLCRQYGLDPKKAVFGHDEFANKACPCFDVKKEFRS